MLKSVNQCHCTIIPPHMSEKIKDADSEELREIARRALERHTHLREQRAQFFSGAASQPSCEQAKHTIVKIYDAEHGEELPGRRVYMPCQSQDESVRESFQWAKITYNFLKDVFNRNSIDGKGMLLKSTVHFDKDYDNAFWNGEQMVYGDGDGKIFGSFTKPIDVTGHELGHGLTQKIQELIYQGQSGALNESLSDYFGIMVKQYHLGQTAAKADWLIGQGLLLGGDWALRSMKAPGTAYVDVPLLGTDPQPATMDAYVDTKEDNGGVHINSGIPNHAFYLFATKLSEYDSEKYAFAWGPAGKVWNEARTKLKPTATFIEFAEATIATADERFGKESPEAKLLREAWAEVKIFNHKPADTCDCKLY